MSRRCSRMVAALALALLLSPRPGAGAPPETQDSAGERELRAVFLLNFARFITWPAEQAEASSPIVFAVVGDPGFASALSKVVEGQTVRGRRLTVLALPDLAAPPPFHVLYLASIKGKNVSEWLAERSPIPILTVSGDRDFCRLGGMIALYSEDRHFRFEISQKALQRSGLRASSQLLALAKPAGGAS